jgi:hypothetical protein
LRFVAVKTVAQQDQAAHRIRAELTKQRTDSSLTFLETVRRRGLLSIAALT